MNAHQWLKEFPYLPYDNENKRDRPSNSVLYRWLKRGSVAISGQTPKPEDEVTFPITQLVFFPKGNTVTMR